MYELNKSRTTGAYSFERARRSRINAAGHSRRELIAIFPLSLPPIPPISPPSLALKSRPGLAGEKSGSQLRFVYIYDRDAYKSGTKRFRPATPGNPGSTRPAKYRLIPPEFLSAAPGREIIRQLARPCSHSNTYIRSLPSGPPPPLPLRVQRRRSVLRRAGGRAGLFKLKSRRDLNFKISIWLANLSASFRPRERTTALPPPRRRGQIARVRHQKSFTSRALFPPSRPSASRSARVAVRLLAASLA